MSKIVNPPVVQEFDGVTLKLVPDEQHEFLLTTKEVAEGYGVGISNIRMQKKNHADELLEGKHFFTVKNIGAGNNNLKQTVWTKRGIVRLGFFIKSERAKKFRDWAEDLVLDKMETIGKQTEPALATVKETIEIADNSLVILDGEETPRITDGLLSQKLGFTSNQMLSALINQMIKDGAFEGNIPPIGVFNHKAAGVCAQQKNLDGQASITVVGSQPVFYLNQKQAVRVVAKTHSDKSDAVMDEIIEIYTQYQTRGIVAKPSVKNLLQKAAKRSDEHIKALIEENQMFANQLERAVVEIQALEFRETIMLMQNALYSATSAASLSKRPDIKTLRSEIGKLLPKRLDGKSIMPRSSLPATINNRLLACGFSPKSWANDTENKLLKNSSSIAGSLLSYLDQEGLNRLLREAGVNSVN